MSQANARFAISIVGLLSLIASGFGIWLSFGSLAEVLAGSMLVIKSQMAEPYFLEVFYVVLLSCIASYVGLAVCGVQLLRQKVSAWSLFSVVCVVEIVAFIFIRTFRTDPVYGTSIYAATSLASRGLTVQRLIFFPVWGPFVVWLARRSMRGGGGHFPPSHRSVGLGT